MLGVIILDGVAMGAAASPSSLRSISSLNLLVYTTALSATSSPCSICATTFYEPSKLPSTCSLLRDLAWGRSIRQEDPKSKRLGHDAMGFGRVRLVVFHYRLTAACTKLLLSSSTPSLVRHHSSMGFGSSGPRRHEGGSAKSWCSSLLAVLNDHIRPPIKTHTKDKLA
jgi:hypothetical protein